jgi:hypothetical protein
MRDVWIGCDRCLVGIWRSGLLHAESIALARASRTGGHDYELLHFEESTRSYGCFSPHLLQVSTVASTG